MACIFSSPTSKDHVVKCSKNLFGGMPHVGLCNVCVQREDLTEIVFDGSIHSLVQGISDFTKEHKLGDKLVISSSSYNEELLKLVHDYQTNGENIDLKMPEKPVKQIAEKKSEKHKEPPKPKYSIKINKNRVKICAGIVNLNMGKFIDKTINSIIECCDKVIVLDGGSTDNSLEVLESFGKKMDIIRFPWQNNFTTVRNVVLERVRDIAPEWYFQIDTDEIMAPAFKENIAYALNRIEADVIHLPILWLISSDPIKYISSDYHTKLAPHRTRIWRYHPSMTFKRERCIHEYMDTPWPQNRMLQIDDLDFAIYHYSYILNSYQDRLYKVRKYDELNPGAGSGDASRPAYLFEEYPFEIRTLQEKS